MLRAIVQTSLRQPFLVLALAAALLVVGYRNLRNAPLDVFPEFAPPLVEIQTEAPGLSTEEVESLVTVPLENALNGTPDLKTMRSKSVLGLSSIVLIFQEGTDLMESRQLVGERLAIEASRLPAVAKPPVILSPLSSTSRVLKIGIWSDKDANGNDVMSQMDMSELARWTIRPRLMAVSGVANVAIWGQRDRQYQVLVDPERLRAHNLSLADVERAAGDAAPWSGGGFVDTPNQRLPVRHVSTIVTAEDLARSVVAFRDGAPLRLGDVAEVQGRSSAADRRRDHQRRPWSAADRRKTADRQHAGRDPQRRSRLGRDEAGLAGRSSRFDDLPPGDVHRDVAARISAGPWRSAACWSS